MSLPELVVVLLAGAAFGLLLWHLPVALADPTPAGPVSAGPVEIDLDRAGGRRSAALTEGGPRG